MPTSSEEFDNTWNLITQEVDETHKDVMATMFSKENLLDMISLLYDQIVSQSIGEAIATVANRHKLDEVTVRKNYFYQGHHNESDTDRTQH
jgi:hypothetical protein